MEDEFKTEVYDKLSDELRERYPTGDDIDPRRVFPYRVTDIGEDVRTLADTYAMIAISEGDMRGKVGDYYLGHKKTFFKYPTSEELGGHFTQEEIDFSEAAYSFHFGWDKRFDAMDQKEKLEELCRRKEVAERTLTDALDDICHKLQGDKSAVKLFLDYSIREYIEYKESLDIEEERIAHRSRFKDTEDPELISKFEEFAEEGVRHDFRYLEQGPREKLDQALEFAHAYIREGIIPKEDLIGKSHRLWVEAQEDE
jgi:hypothetical protein